MTQVASPESVRGNFNDVNLNLDGDDYRLHRRGDEFWVEMVDPNWKMEHPATSPSFSSGRKAPQSKLGDLTVPRVERHVSMVTGSHQMQAYWIDNGYGNQQFSLPFTYLFEQRALGAAALRFFLKTPNELRCHNKSGTVGCVDCR